jgi:hypothetical protein
MDDPGVVEELIDVAVLVLFVFPSQDQPIGTQCEQQLLIGLS